MRRYRYTSRHTRPRNYWPDYYPLAIRRPDTCPTCHTDLAAGTECWYSARAKAVCCSTCYALWTERVREEEDTCQRNQDIINRGRY